MKHTAAILFFALLFTGTATAQVDREAYLKQQQKMREQYAQGRDKARQQYDGARKKAEAQYAAFRKKANEDYAKAMEQAWKEMRIQPAKEKPKEPTPPKPPKPAPDRVITMEKLPQAKEVSTIAKKEPIPAPAIPVADDKEPTINFTMYGTDCLMHADTQKLRFRLSSVDKKGTLAAWKTLSKMDFDGMLHDCLEQRDAHHLGDWGYLCLLQNATERLVGKGTNEAVMLQMYLLTQSGYNVRLGNQSGTLVLLIPFTNDLYNYAYVPIDGKRYYVLSKVRNGSLEVCDLNYAREKTPNVQMSKIPALGGKPTAKRIFAAQKFGTMKASVATDKNLIAFLNDYPLSNDWDSYALAGLSETVKADLYPVLRSQIEGKSKKKAAAMLLDFVQTGFDYATDREQFGYERPLFADESFYYPKNDCEDRSILYSILVRDLLGLDVVLVNWPGHIATAVAFPETVEGDYYLVGGRRYTICDPTYIGAGIGETMPQFKKEEAKLLKL